jgi:Glyoxalase-like domain
MQTCLDHLVIGAASLEAGIEYVKEVLGVDIPAGGHHEKMGTCNHLMQLGNDVFLEVIAIDETLAAPSRPRWYGLDDPFVVQKIKTRPALLTWVVNTPDIKGFQSNTMFSFGTFEQVSRGQLSWLFGIPDDGRLLAAGMVPYVIEWMTKPHPVKTMSDKGCHLKALHIHHPHADWLQNILSDVGAADLVEIHPLNGHEAPRLTAQIETPSGIIEL